MKTEKHVVILWLIISLLLPTLACAQYKFDNVLYGAAYYQIGRASCRERV